LICCGSESLRWLGVSLHCGPRGPIQSSVDERPRDAVGGGPRKSEARAQREASLIAAIINIRSAEAP